MANNGFQRKCWFIKKKIFQTKWTGLLPRDCTISKKYSGATCLDFVTVPYPLAPEFHSVVTEVVWNTNTASGTQISQKGIIIACTKLTKGYAISSIISIGSSDRG